MPSTSLIRALVLAVAFLAAGFAAPLRLIENGKSTYTIVIACEATQSEVRAANELQRFLYEITGVRLPIHKDDSGQRVGNMILVGRSHITDEMRLHIPIAQLGPEGFVIKTAGQDLVIVGGYERGSMYGVYTFLEKLGCRWVARDASRIPHRRTITVPPLDEIYKPDFEYRDVYIAEGFDKDWAARNRTNGFASQLDASTGGKIQYYPFVHSFYQILPPEKYFKDHPEYYSLIDGKRRGERAQLCLTNPGVFRLTVEKVLEWRQQHPEAKIFSVSQNDYYGQCECDRCKRVAAEEGGADSGPLLRFVNAVAEEVEKTYPDIWIDTLAYFYSEAPPSQARPRANVRVRMCPIGACQSHPYEKCPHDAYIVKNLQAWAKITGNMYVWHYNANFSHYLLPVPDFDELAADIPMYKRNGVAGLFMEGSVPAGASEAPLRAYVLAKLLWDVKTDVWKTIDEFNEIYYGKAARAMRAYIDLLQSLVRTPGGGQHWWCCRAPSMDDATLARAKAIFQRAHAAAENDTIRKRIDQAEISLRYVELKKLQAFTIRDGQYAPRDIDPLRKVFMAFMSDARRLGVTRLSENAAIEQDEKEFLDSLRAYSVVRLENAALRVQVVPELNGRIVQMLDKRSGRELLNQPATVESNYPNRTGQTVNVYTDYVNAPAFAVKWTIEGQPAASALALRGDTAQGLLLHRRIELMNGEPKLRIETVLENTAKSPIEAVIQSQFEADAGNMLTARVEFQTRDGHAIARQLLQPAEQPVGTETYAGPAVPAGQWRVVNAGVALASAFDPSAIDRAILGWSAKSQSRVSLSVWSKRRTLNPGESTKLEVEYAAH